MGSTDEEEEERTRKQEQNQTKAVQIGAAIDVSVDALFSILGYIQSNS